MTEFRMAISFILLPAILISLPLSAAETAAVDSSMYSETASFCTDRLNQKSLPCEVEELKLKLNRLESILEENSRLSNAKSLYMREIEKRIEEFSLEIHRLREILSSIEVDSLRVNQRLDVLEKEVRLLWDASRRNNFEILSLEHKALEAERRLKAASSQVQGMAEIVSEQWIQIQHLEQAVHMAEVYPCWTIHLQLNEKSYFKTIALSAERTCVFQLRTLKFKREVTWNRCPFLKFIKTTFSPYVEMLKRILDPYLTPVWRYCKSHVLKTFSAAKLYHHQLQGFVKHSMQINELTAALAHEEVIFFLASALVAFPVVSAIMLLA